MTQSPTLEIENLCKKFRARVVLSGVTVSAYAGEILGFLGPNGSGKTTTIKLMLGLLRADAGRIAICGHPVEGDFEGAMALVGGIVENPEMYRYLTGRQNLLCFARMCDGVPASRIDEVASLVRLEGRLDDKVSSYSLGMRQRLGLAQALLARPRLLVLDEPTNGLDPSGIRDLRETLKTLSHEEGVTVFLSSHMLSELDQLCDRVAILEGGRVKGCMTMEEIRHVGVAGVDTLAFSTLREDAARETLTSLGLSFSKDEMSGRLVVSMPHERVPEVISLLAERAGLRAAVPVERTLEEAFLAQTTAFGENP